jgi:adenosine deaminase
MMRALTWIALLPKAETHYHLEGSIKPKTLFELAQKYQKPLPYSSVKEMKHDLQMKPGDHLHDFLRKVEIARFVFAHPEAIRRVAYEAVEDAAKSNVKYMEIELNPDKPDGLSPSRILKETVKGARLAGKKFGVKVYVIAALNRSYPLDRAWKVAKAAVSNFKHRGGVVALGLAADEAHYPPDRFKEIFTWAKNQGLKVVIHAGEAAGPESIRKALECGADALDHGTRLQQDPELEKEVAQKKIPLRMCPTSNCALSVIPNMKAFPIKRYITKGIPVSISRDDPAYFGGISLNHEYEKVFRENKLTPDELKEVALNGFRYSFAPLRVKQALVQKVSRWLEAVSQNEAPKPSG